MEAKMVRKNSKPLVTARNVLLALALAVPLAATLSTTARAEDWRAREWREHEWRAYAYPYGYYAPYDYGYYYAPPPVVYAPPPPPPVIYAPAPAAISLGFTFR
jgi:hypothetical protein